MSTPSHTTPGPRIRSVQHPVGDVGAAVSFYGAVFGFEPRFVDGARYAALDAGDTTLALAGAAEDLTGGVVAASVNVADVAATLAALVGAGGSVVQDAAHGPHEVRAVARDPWGNHLIVYAPH